MLSIDKRLLKRFVFPRVTFYITIVLLKFMKIFIMSIPGVILGVMAVLVEASKATSLLSTVSELIVIKASG